MVDTCSVFFTLNPFDIEKALCIETVIYSCSVVGPDASDYSDLCTGFDGTLATNNLALLASYSDLDVAGGDLPAGDYTFTITATTQYGATETADFLWVLSDPCFSLTTFAPEEQGDLADKPIRPHFGAKSDITHLARF